MNASKPEHHRTYRSTQRPHRQPARTGVGEMSEMNKMSEGSGREYRVKSGDVEVVHESKDLASQRSTVKKRNAHRVSGDRSKADSS